MHRAGNFRKIQPILKSFFASQNSIAYFLGHRSRNGQVNRIFPVFTPVQDLRDVVLGTNDALAALLLNVTQPATESLLRNCVWALSNMCRGKPQPEVQLLAPALPVLLGLLASPDKEVKFNHLFACLDFLGYRQPSNQMTDTSTREW